jgi:hypothetical protein
MKKKKKPKKRSNTHHRQTVITPAVSKEIRRLSKSWNELHRIERGDRLWALVDQGCTARGLAADLGQSPTSILRHMALARLPEADREAVKAGKSAKKIMALKAVEDRRRRMQQRIAEEAQTGVISDKLADEVLEFCKTEPGVRGSDVETATLFFNEVRNSLTRLEWSGEQAPRVKKSLPLTQRFKVTRPRPEKEEVTTAHLARWLALFLKSEAPERPILDRAIDKAEARRNELKVESTKRGRRALYDAVQRYAQLSASPPPRKHSAKGASSLRGSY